VRGVLVALALAALATWSAAAPEGDLGVRYADAIASLDGAFAMRREARPDGVVYSGYAGDAALILHVRADVVREAQLTTELPAPEAATMHVDVRDLALRGRFVTNVLPSWHQAALGWIDANVRELSPAAAAGRPQSRSIHRAGTELRLDLASGGATDGRQSLRLMLTVRPDAAAPAQHR